jgi:hypothetical protein
MKKINACTRREENPYKTEEHMLTAPELGGNVPGPVCDDTSTEKLRTLVQKEKGEQESYVAGSHIKHIHKNMPTIYEGKNEF